MSGTVFTSHRWMPVTAAQLQDHLRRRPPDACARAAELLAVAPGDRDETHAEAALVCMETLTEELQSPAPGADPVPAIAALLDLQEVVTDLHEHQAADRLRRIAGCERGLRRLRRVTTQAGLIDRVCDELASSCGFGRVLLSRVEEGMWRPWMVNSSVLGADWFTEWGAKAIPLAELDLERRVVRERRPALLREAVSVDLHRIFRQTATGSYVAAPIMPGGTVVGILHGDRMAGGRACDETDRDVLWVFAQAFSRLYERVALLERLRGQSRRMRASLRLADAALLQLSTFELEVALNPDDRPVAELSASVCDTGLERLTPRELDVLRLVAQGATNQGIADELVIAVATVKSHVNRVLAKLGVHNRSQAIVHYRRAERGDFA